MIHLLWKQVIAVTLEKVVQPLSTQNLSVYIPQRTPRSRLFLNICAAGTPMSINFLQVIEGRNDEAPFVETWTIVIGWDSLQFLHLQGKLVCMSISEASLHFHYRCAFSCNSYAVQLHRNGRVLAGDLAHARPVGILVTVLLRSKRVCWIYNAKIIGTSTK